ncbi:MAG: ATP-binding domain-containing protein [Flavobacteriales bacterium]|nr:ATP-binding domain-containing protein [Flavobacteriales bacterium]
MVDIKQGQNKKIASSQALVEFFKQKDSLNGKLYIGYPILYTGGENIILDAIWISPEKGIIVFDLIEGTTFENKEEYRDKLYNKVESELRSYSELTRRRDLLIPIEVITYSPESSVLPDDNYACNKDSLEDLINQIPVWSNHDGDIFKKTISVIQSVIQITVKSDRTNVKKTDSKGAIVKRLEETIANLDNQQESAIIEYNGGLQRIRGLAGSGKTIVLALKAAYLHALNPDWNIIVTFNTRSLKNQFQELIELFCIQKIGRKPDENKIKIIQAWGSKSNTGIYYEFCKQNNVEYFDFRSARAYSSKIKLTPFDAVCKKALGETKNTTINVKYDAILVDEDQDLSESFLNLCYKILTDKKRLIYAYDELQKLHEGSPLTNPKNMFNEDKFSDIILQKCYRNPRPVLTTAHALGFGIYRKRGLVQFFDQPELWEELGYIEKSGNLLKGGNQISLHRAEQATHKFLEQETSIDDIISFHNCSSKQEQAEQIANDIETNLNNDELLHRDIIVINPMALTTKNEVALVRKCLDSKGIKTHIAGESNKDEFFRSDSIAFTGINRAKGNEVPVVYIMNAQDCYSHPILPNRGLRERRNILFTAITRSKAWVKVYGIGQHMELLSNEFLEVKKANFSLNFLYPTKEEIEKMNLISRDVSIDEEKEFKEETQSLFGITKILEKVKSGQTSIEDYPEDFQKIIRTLLENEG